MTHYLMIQELYWKSDTSRANVQPTTNEINPRNLNEGIVLWFKWDTTNRALEYLSESDRGSNCNFPFTKDFERRCTTTLLYCEKDGFSSIPYHPFRDNEEWLHWWSLGFNREDRGIFKLERDDETFGKKQIPGNGSGWFHLFRNTQHHTSPSVINNDRPLLTGAVSLIWALAAFQFNAGTLSSCLPGALSCDGNLHVLCKEQAYLSGKFPGMSQRALAVELWVHKGGPATVEAPSLC
ncbi:hypothetical protein EV426DRAFT_90536 [Tirmania nivea]|nr:hypothetical protein EV426DRAFT_90536 [Tirmania nivea]